MQYQEHKVSKLNPAGAIHLTEGWELPTEPQGRHKSRRGESRVWEPTDTPHLINQHAGTVHPGIKSGIKSYRLKMLCMNDTIQPSAETCCPTRN
ncbi:acetolactate synthase small subunit 1, chloroplastic [Dorcoceras hygrometricum]|uniref:Acetolactate synthase small subunit 1, chloroplastic n=1 Tax=Dorcoceras hygrometricum TaxID=472368 RepID=A0A2Z7C064_9LAMI|nr:acetolactate synthase small subunit 1, chloroplastic [Dorcoceras hygrometricum]